MPISSWVSWVFAAAALPPGGGVLRPTRITFLVAGVLATASVVGLGWGYGRDLGYRYEVAAISIDSPALTLSGVLVALAVRQGPLGDRRSGPQGARP